MSVKKAIIPCAGFGTRFLPLTKVMPKELLPIADTPALCYLLDEARESGIEEVMIVLSPQKQYIKKLFEPNVALNAHLEEQGKSEALALANKDFGMKISFVTQKEMKGNGRAVALCKKFAEGAPVAVLFGDDVMFTGEGTPVTKQLIMAYEITGATIVGCQRCPEDVARKCGVMIPGERITERVTRVKGIIEKPEGALPSDLTSLGRFVLTPDIFGAIERTPEKDGEVYLTDAIGTLAAEGMSVCACEFDARRYDIGDKLGYLEANVEYALRDGELGERFAEYLKSLNDRFMI